MVAEFSILVLARLLSFVPNCGLDSPWLNELSDGEKSTEDETETTNNDVSDAKEWISTAQ